MNKRKPGLAVMIAGLVLTHSAGATVIISETLAEKVGSSRTVALAEVTGIEGQGPFNNGHRPVVDLRVLRAWRGAQAGDRVQIKEWSNSPAFAYYADGLPPRPEQIEQARKQWAAAVVTPPHQGEHVLLMLGQQPDLPADAGVSYPDHVASPDPRTLELVEGFLTYSVELTPEDDVRVNKGAPIRSALTVHNLSAQDASFSPGSIRLSLTTPQGTTLDRAAPTAPKALPAVAVPRGGQAVVPLDWQALYPGLFDAAGDYWLTIEIPAQGGDRLQRHVVVSEHSVAEACGRAGQILRVRLRSLTRDAVAYEDPVYLRLRGEPLPPTLARSDDLATAAAGQRWILCVESGQLTFAGPDTEAFRQQLGTLLANDPLEWWSHAEDADPRFAAPANRAEAPASVMHQDDLQRRLQALP